LAEDLILWATSEFDFIKIADAYTTGSSLMPQKKNPDVAELARGKAGRVFGSLTALLTLLKGLPLAYNRDLQEDKEPLFDAVDTVTRTLAVLAAMLRSVKVNRESMRRAAEDGFITATDLADYLVRKGMPFRQAHALVGRSVLRAIGLGVGLKDLPLDEYRRLSPLIRSDVFDALSVQTSVSRRTSFGGTAQANVKKRLASLKKALK
jgi:argininosuccinate lyase